MTRRRLQLHLGTLLIVLLLASGLVLLNVRKREIVLRDDDVAVTYFDFKCRGFPWTFQELYDSPPVSVEKLRAYGWRSTPLEKENEGIGGFAYRPEIFSRKHLAMNIAVAMLLLAVATAAIEWLTRWMKRKPTQ